MKIKFFKSSKFHKEIGIRLLNRSDRFYHEITIEINLWFGGIDIIFMLRESS